MFGYVTVYKPELKIKDYDTYKGIYCTLCKRLQSEYGFFSRFLLSYDATFYVLYRMGVTDSCTKFSKSHCSFSPCKKCLSIDSDEEIFNKAAAITVILSYFKLCDDIGDSGFFKKTLYKMLKPYFNHICRKAQKRYSDILNIVEKYMVKQAEAESDFQSLDEVADPSGKILGYILSDGDEASVDYRIGYNLGRAVYFLDAFDDYINDVKTCSFNPFKNSDNIIEDAGIALNISIGELTDYLKTIKFYRFKEIIYNIVFEGLEHNRKKIVKKMRGENNE